MIASVLRNDGRASLHKRPTNSPPESGFVRSWQGTFSGVKDTEDITKFNIFTNQSLFPGWQLNPCVAGGPDVPPGCQSAGSKVYGGNAFSSQVSYDFDSDGTPDRIEQYLMMSLSIGNSWSYENKQTNYKFDQQWPSSPPPMLLGGTDGTKKADFPAFIDPAKPATITVQMWGGTLCELSDCVKASYSVPISVNADPVTDRASWIEPPYGPSPEPGSFAPVTPARVLDTRNNQGANGPVPANGVIDVQLTGQGGILAGGVSAVAINVTAVSPSAAGWISAWPSGSAQPTSSILNFAAGETTPNMVVLPVGPDGKVKLSNGSPGTVQLLGDVTGYFIGGTPTAPGSLDPLTPARVLDTRISLGATGQVPANGVIDVQLTGQGGIPASGVSAVAVNVTAVSPTAPGFISAWPSSSLQPTTSILNFTAGQTTPNMVVLPVGPDGKVKLFNGSAGSVQLLADVTGYFIGGTPQ